MSSNTSSKVSSSLTPRNQSSPFGTLSNTKHSTVYTPTYFPGQQTTLDAAPQNVANLVTNDIPQATTQYENTLSNYLNNANSLTAGNMINPQVYNATYNSEVNPLLTSYNNQVNQLNGNLAAQNLTGGSYDALAHNYLNQNLGQEENQASNNAVLAGLTGTQDFLGLQQNAANTAGSGVNTLSTLANNYQTLDQNLQSQLMNPFQQYTSYQSAVDPLQQQLANYYSQSAGAAGSGIGTAVGAGAGALLGSVVPGVGTAIGAGIGGAIGSGIGGSMSGGVFTPSSVPIYQYGNNSNMQPILGSGSNSNGPAPVPAQYSGGQ